MIYTRMRLIACHVWGCPPWEFDAAVRRGELTMEDIIEAVQLEACHMEIDVGRYLFREREADLAARHEKIMRLSRRMEGEKDPDVRAKLAAEIDELNHG